MHLYAMIFHARDMGEKNNLFAKIFGGTAERAMKHNGSCLCGAVRFTVDGELHEPDACHCTQCRKQSGHYWVSTNVKRDALALEGADKLTWYQSSDKVRRGFCSVCGSFLFWDPVKHDIVGVGMGAFEKPTGTKIEKHIFVASKGDYYDITDGLPQSDDY
jgi:hypothetical protein